MRIPTSPQGHPNFTGVWLANLEKSTLRGVPPKQILNKIEHREPHLDQETLVEQTNGDEQRVVFSYETTGDETINSIGDRTGRTRARWNGSELVIDSWLEIAGRELHFEDHWSLSDDGQTVTMAHSEDPLAGQIVVHERAAL